MDGERNARPRREYTRTPADFSNFYAGVEWPGFLGGWGSVGPTCPPMARIAAWGRRARQWRGLPRGAAVPANGEG